MGKFGLGPEGVTLGGLEGPQSARRRDARVELSAREDLELVEMARQGHAGAFRELYERYHRRVYAIALGVVRNPEAAMDVTQDAFVKLHRYLDRFEGNSSFYTWLYRLVKNQSIDYLRRNKRHQASTFDESVVKAGKGAQTAVRELQLSDLLSNLGDPRAAVQREEVRQAVAKALETLSAKHRAVIVLRELEGLSYAEIAKVESVSKGTVMSRLFHARRKMQAALKQSLQGVVQSSTDPKADPAGKASGSRKEQHS